MCFFCKEPGGSEEHIISKSVRSRMQITDVEIESGIREADDYGHFRNPHRFERMVTHEVCDTGNRGWMSKLEIDFLDAVGQLIEPNWPARSAEVVGEATKRSDVIATWAI